MIYKITSETIFNNWADQSKDEERKEAVSDSLFLHICALRAPPNCNIIYHDNSSQRPMITWMQSSVSRVEPWGHRCFDCDLHCGLWEQQSPQPEHSWMPGLWKWSWHSMWVTITNLEGIHCTAIANFKGSFWFLLHILLTYLLVQLMLWYLPSHRCTLRKSDFNSACCLFLTLYLQLSQNLQLLWEPARHCTWTNIGVQELLPWGGRNFCQDTNQ